eukprot:3281151-Pleurochrysis_carterae.AAC.5
MSCRHTRLKYLEAASLRVEAIFCRCVLLLTSIPVACVLLNTSGRFQPFFAVLSFTFLFERCLDAAHTSSSTRVAAPAPRSSTPGRRYLLPRSPVAGARLRGSVQRAASSELCYPYRVPQPQPGGGGGARSEVRGKAPLAYSTVALRSRLDTMASYGDWVRYHHVPARDRSPRVE